MASIDRATTGVNQVTLTWGGSQHDGVIGMEIAGTAATSFDQFHYDNALVSGGAFTSGATPSTSVPNELLVGSVNVYTGVGGNGGAPPLCGVTGSSGWSTAYSGEGFGTPKLGMYLLTKTVSSSGAQTETGTVNSGTDNCSGAGIVLLGLSTFE